MRGSPGHTHERVLRRHAVAVRRVCALILGEGPGADAAAEHAQALAPSAIGRATRPGDRLPRLLALAVFACDGREAADDAGDPWAPVRDLPPAERTALLLHEGAGLSVRRDRRRSSMRSQKESPAASGAGSGISGMNL